jgi:hypothetical protein
MARYYFDTYDAEGDREREAFDFPDAAAAKRSAISFAGRILSEIGERLFHNDFRLEVMNEHGLILYSLIVVATDMIEATQGSMAIM